jgi:hypothetical protein
VSRNRRAGRVRHQTDGARSRFRLAGVVMGRLHRRCPQHQGQAEPNRKSHPKTHDLLLGVRLVPAYNGYPFTGNKVRSSGKLLWAWRAEAEAVAKPAKPISHELSREAEEEAAQPRSGERMQPTAQAVGKMRRDYNQPR